MEQRAHNEGRDLVLWLVGMPLAVTAASVTLLALLSAINPHRDYGVSDLPLTVLLVTGFGLPAALIARAMIRHRPSGWMYFALTGAATGFIGFAALAVLLIWAEGSDDMFTAITGATWRGAGRAARLTVTIAWPGALAGLAGGIVFGAFAKWAGKGR